MTIDSLFLPRAVFLAAFLPLRAALRGAALLATFLLVAFFATFLLVALRLVVFFAITGSF